MIIGILKIGGFLRVFTTYKKQKNEVPSFLLFHLQKHLNAYYKKYNSKEKENICAHLPLSFCTRIREIARKEGVYMRTIFWKALALFVAMYEKDLITFEADELLFLKEHINIYEQRKAIEKRNVHKYNLKNLKNLKL